MPCWRRLAFTTTTETMLIWELHAVNISESVASALSTLGILTLSRACQASSKIALNGCCRNLNVIFLNFTRK
nr:hypothetical protein T12_8556 [Ipomoea batatas]